MKAPAGYDERVLLVAFVDLRRYARICGSSSDGDMFALISTFSEMVGEVVEGAGGRVLKMIGDAALIIFEVEDAARGVAALRVLKADVDRWLRSQDLDSELLVRANLGPVAVGEIGPRGDKRLDVIGRVVNETAMLKRGPFVMTPPLKEAVDGS